MELNLFNDILTETIDKVVSGIVDRPNRVLNRQEGRKGDMSRQSSDFRDSNRLIQSCFISRDGSRDLSFESEVAGKGSNPISRQPVSANDSFAKLSEGSTRPSQASRPGSSGSQGGSGSGSQKDQLAKTAPTGGYPQLITKCTVQEWLNHNAPILLKISAGRLGLNLDQLETINLTGVPEDKLVEMKKKAKQELKEYDNKFSSEFHKQPTREEKEPMRPLYIYYRALKQAMEGPAPNPQDVLDRLFDELVAKKSQRNELRAKLEAYQEEFVRKHNRRIRFRNDILEVEPDYNLYKKLKDDITSLEEKCRQHLVAHPGLRGPS